MNPSICICCFTINVPVPCCLLHYMLSFLVASTTVHEILNYNIDYLWVNLLLALAKREKKAGRIATAYHHQMGKMFTSSRGKRLNWATEINSPYCWELQYWCCAIRVSNLTFNLFHIFCCLLLPLTILWYYHCQLIQEKKKRKRELQKLGRKGKDKKERTLLTDFYLIYKLLM